MTRIPSKISRIACHPRLCDAYSNPTNMPMGMAMIPPQRCNPAIINKITAMIIRPIQFPDPNISSLKNSMNSPAI